MAVSFKELINAFEFAGTDTGMYENEAFLCRETGAVYTRSELFDDDDLPDDLDDETKYLRLPHRRELGLGAPLVFAFIRECRPDDYDEVSDIFSRKGAYARYKAFLHRRGALDQWHDFEAKAEEAALRDWCEQHSIELAE